MRVDGTSMELYVTKKIYTFRPNTIDVFIWIIFNMYETVSRDYRIKKAYC